MVDNIDPVAGLLVAHGNQETSHHEYVQHRKGESEKADDYLTYFGLKRSKNYFCVLCIICFLFLCSFNFAFQQYLPDLS